MAESKSETDARKEALFLSLVALLSQQAMMAMGKIVPPGAEEPTVDLEVTRAMIDTLEVLRERSEGNRTSEESRYLELQLTNLRLTFLECQKEASGEGAAAAKGDDEDAAAENAAD